MSERRTLTVPLSQWQALPEKCGWEGCTRTFERDHMPPTWTCLMVVEGPIEPAMFPTKAPPNGKRTIALDLYALSWRHDKVLCPEHSAALDRLLGPGSGGASN